MKFFKPVTAHELFENSKNKSAWQPRHNDRINIAGMEIQALFLDKRGAKVQPITSDILPVPVHYCEGEGLNRYIQCNGEDDDCIYCKVGEEKKTQFLLPVYHVLTESIRILRMGDSDENGALLPQIVSRLTSLTDPLSEIYKIKKFSNYHYEVSTLSVDDLEIITPPIVEQFYHHYEEIGIALARLIPRFSNEEMSKFPEIAEQLEDLR